MARTRVFVSSTYYDLKYVRAALETFIRASGFDPVLSEKGNIPYLPDISLAESCYREVTSADMLILIVGGRYGSTGSGDPVPTDFYDRYNSITQGEFEIAIERGIPVFVFVDHAVYYELQTFKANRDNKTINYAHVKSVNVFLLLEQILGLEKNNQVHPFEHLDDIISILREQWSGIIHNLLRDRTPSGDLNSLRNQVTDLRQVMETLRKYLEALMPNVTGAEEASQLIGQQGDRLTTVQSASIDGQGLVRYLKRMSGIDTERLRRLVVEANSTEDFLSRVIETSKSSDEVSTVLQPLTKNVAFLADVNALRAILGAPPLPS